MLINQLTVREKRTILENLITLRKKDKQKNRLKDKELQLIILEKLIKLKENKK